MMAQHLTSALVSVALGAAGLAGMGLEDAGPAASLSGETAEAVAAAAGSGVVFGGADESDAPAVRSVRVTSEGSETVISIAAGAETSVQDFLLAEPTRLVVDLKQASHALSRMNYSVGRGGIVRLRTSQFRDGVVRLVFELTRRPDYELDRANGVVEIRFSNPGGGFVAWSTGTGTVEEISVTGSDPAPGYQQQRVPRITVTYDQASVQDVLAGFSEFAGVSMVPSPEAAQQTVRGITIENKPWDEALDAILASQGLGWERLPSGIIVVDEMAALRSRDTLQTETRVFRINYADAASVAEALTELTTGDRGQVVPYEGTNSVLVTDSPPAVARMDSLVNVLDQRTAQVAIEAKIIFVNRTRTDALGIKYDLKDQTGEVGFNQPVPAGGVPPGERQQQQQRVPFAVDLTGSAIAATANASSDIPSPALEILANTVFGGFSLTTFLDALQSEQLSDIQATPSVKVVDNQQARIQVGQRVPIRVLETQAQVQQAQVSVQFEETGIILEATPHVTNNNQILLDLHAERSGIAEAGGDIGVSFDTQEADTRLLLDNGETGVFGGLTLSDVSRTESGIPLLMDLPLVGNLFKTTQETERKQDLIILVTPRIVGSAGTGAMPGADGPAGSPGR